MIISVYIFDMSIDLQVLVLQVLCDKLTDKSYRDKRLQFNNKTTSHNNGFLSHEEINFTTKKK